VLGTKVTAASLPGSASVTIEDAPRVLGTLPSRVRGQVLAFIRQNQDVLLRHWRGVLNSRQA
jgi:hypothetical protein